MNGMEKYGQDLMFGLGPGGKRKRKTIADRGFMPNGTPAKNPELARLAQLMPLREQAARLVSQAQANFDQIDSEIKQLQQLISEQVEVVPPKPKRKKHVEEVSVEENA